MPNTTPSLAITWRQPTFLLPLFCLCTLLGVSNSLASAIGLALAIIIAVVLSVLAIALLNSFFPEDIGVVSWLLLGSAIVAVIELLMQAHFYGLYRVAGMYLPLIVIACLLVARKEMRAEQGGILQAVRRAALMSVGLAIAAVVLGGARELVGHGSLFYDAGAVFGPWAQRLTMQLFRADMGFLLAVLAPGAFIGLGIGVALYNWFWLQLFERKH
jgi:electron transport complex protein RnfE